MERGRNEKRICEPSSGGIGNKLNTAKRILRNTILTKTEASSGLIMVVGTNRNAKPKVNAIARLAPGPAKLTKIGPHF